MGYNKANSANQRLTMFVERYFKTLLAFIIAVFCLSVGIDNIIDYQVNYEFVKHVVQMDTMKTWFDLDISIKRGISNPAIHALLFHIIIASELISGLLALYSAFTMMKSIKDHALFRAAKSTFVMSAGLMLTIWYFGFNVVAANWFYMWANVYDAQAPAYNFSIMILLGTIYIMQKEDH
jgi:predicted small integral membrane protein